MLNVPKQYRKPIAESFEKLKDNDLMIMAQIIIDEVSKRNLKI